MVIIDKGVWRAERLGIAEMLETSGENAESSRGTNRARWLYGRNEP